VTDAEGVQGLEYRQAPAGKRRLAPTLLWVAVSALFIASIPAFLISTNARWAINEPRLYNLGFAWFDVPESTGISQEQLERGGQQIRDYFNNNDGLLDLRVILNGAEVSLYKEREVLHMGDVKGLIQGVYKLQLASLAYLLIAGAAVLYLFRREGVARLSRLAILGAALTLGIGAVVGIASLVAWNQVFLLFHYISFDNLLWILNPRTDYLIRMFPTGFFLTATILIAGVTLAECVVLVLLARFVRRRWAAKE
jgi:integral membrane protein (TIGR01906 family)